MDLTKLTTFKKRKPKRKKSSKLEEWELEKLLRMKRRKNSYISDDYRRNNFHYSTLFYLHNSYKNSNFSQLQTKYNFGISENYSLPKMVIKTNFRSAGFLYNNKRLTKKTLTVESLIPAIKYIERDSSQNKEDLENDMSNCYIGNERLSRDSYQEFINGLKEEYAGSFRRVIISPDPQYNLSKDDLVQLTEKTVESYYSDNKEVAHIFAPHSHSQTPHVHLILIGDSANSLTMSKQDIYELKNEFSQNLQILLNEKELQQTNTLDLDYLKEFDDSKQLEKDYLELNEEKIDRELTR